MDRPNGNRNPRVPREKLSTGGTGPLLNNEEAWRMVPSPPSVMTRSMRGFDIDCGSNTEVAAGRGLWDEGGS
jgi:hypothetical protein